MLPFYLHSLLNSLPMDKPSLAGDLQPQVHSADRTATIYGPTLNEYACFVFRNFLFRTKQNTSVYIPANVTPVLRNDTAM